MDNMPVQEIQEEVPRSFGLECPICLAPPTDPVATACGHLFCWPCLYRWLEGQPRPCPVCRAMLRNDINITPVYGSHDEGAGARDSDQGGAPSVDGVCIPPRPGLPPPSIVIAMDAAGSGQMRTVGATSTHQINSDSLRAVATLLEMNDLSQRARRELSAALEAERAQVNVLRRERRHLMASLHYLRHRNLTLIHEAGERARRQHEERQAFVNSLRVLVSEDHLLETSHAHHHHPL